MTSRPPLAPRLTVREHKAVWMLSQGRSLQEIAAELGIRRDGASGVLVRARDKFGYASRYPFLAAMILDGHVGRYLDCGKSLAAYQRHHQKDEEPCPACRRFKAQRNKMLDEPVRTDLHLTHREAQVLRAIASGADSMAEIGAVIGLGRRSTASILARLYTAFNIPHRDNRDRRRILLYVARSRGYAPLSDGTYRTRSGVIQVPPQMRLSPRQVELLLACQDGAPLSEVGRRCGISREAASARLSEIYRRLGLERSARGNDARRERRTEAYRRAKEYGLLD